MADKVDNIKIGDLYSTNYIKDTGLVDSPSFEDLYNTKLRTDLTAQSSGVVNTGATDDSAVVEIISGNSINISSNTGVEFKNAVTMGMVDGYWIQDKFGENPDVDTGVAEDIWEYGGLYNYDAPGTAPIQYVSSSSTSDTGQTITILGLDITGTEVEQTITTNGQNVVTLTTPLWRVYRMQNSGDIGTDLVGVLYCHTDPTPTAGVPAGVSVRAIINNGNNQTLMALYTIPLGKVGFLYRGELGLSRPVSSGAVTCGYYSRRVGKLFTIKKRLELSVTGSSIYQDERSFPDVVPALTDIRLTVDEASANNMGVFGAFDLLIVDEDKLTDQFLTAIGQPTEMPN